MIHPSSTSSLPVFPVKPAFSAFVPGLGGLVGIGATSVPNGNLLAVYAPSNNALSLQVAQNSTAIQTYNTSSAGSYDAAAFMSGSTCCNVVGQIVAGQNNTSYNTTSDRRLKENIKPSAHGLDLLTALPVNDFNFIADSKKERVQGFIAQDL